MSGWHELRNFGDALAPQGLRNFRDALAPQGLRNLLETLVVPQTGIGVGEA